MKIFESYTGNAMLNNALMTIEALGNLKSVSEITQEILLKLYKDKNLLGLNKRLKSYTMLFTKNGPLHNDKARGDKTYDSLFKTIINNFENEGDKTCEISGLSFNTSFNAIYEKALMGIGISKEEIKKKDTSLSRTWFPLIGGLGSDAQALPQAKFSIQIHPICIAILQFLPLSALLYKGGVLLIDSSNFEFSKTYVSENCKTLKERIETTKSNESVENVKDFSKGNYVLKALKILEDKNFDDEYSDLNLWSFSNSGTGASCEIDRIPNSLFKKLNILYSNPNTVWELKVILNNSNTDSANPFFNFLTSLEGNIEWGLLYPNAFKKVKYDGVSASFLEAYFKIIESGQKLEYAKYLAYLINKYKSKSFEKYLDSTSAWNEKNYRIDLYSVLAEATQNGEWSLYHHLNILDDANQLPVKNTFYGLHKLVHFYYQKKVFESSKPKLENKASLSRTVSEWIITLIQNDSKKDRIIKDLKDPQKYSSVKYSGLLLRANNNQNLNLETIINLLYDENLTISLFGLNELLRLYFSQDKCFNTEINNANPVYKVDIQTIEYLERIRNFTKDYQSYYFDKYENKETGAKPYSKFINLINHIYLDTLKFFSWFREAQENTNKYLTTNEVGNSRQWSDDLLYNPHGDFAISFAKFAIKFSLLKQFQESILVQEQIVIS